MKINQLRVTLAFAGLVAISVSACKKDGSSNKISVSGPDNLERKYITLTGAFPDATGEAGNGGTKAYAVTLEQAADPNYVVNVFANGYTLRSQRTARVQGSVNGNQLYNIQYTGTDGGIFNKYWVKGGNVFEDTKEELDTEPILGASPRWVVAAEGIGVGVFASAQVTASGEGKDADFIDVKSTAKIAVIDLHDPVIRRSVEFTIPFSAAQTKDGYQIGRIDMPILNSAKTKLFIGCNLTRIDKSKKSGVNATSGAQTWSTTTNELGTATLVVDYPSLQNPQLIYSTQSSFGNNGYRTMIQHLDENGNIYQATGANTTGYAHILKIDKNTNTYDNTYLFNLKSALNSDKDVAIKAWRYVKNNIGIVLYTVNGVNGGYLALIDLNAKTAVKLATENETHQGFSGLTANQNGGTVLTGSFTQFQNIGLIGDKIYVPMTPNGIDGNLYIIDANLKTVKKGAQLKNQSGSFYLGAY